MTILKESHAENYAKEGGQKQKLGVQWIQGLAINEYQSYYTEEMCKRAYPKLMWLDLELVVDELAVEPAKVPAPRV
jgi:hypothetical protein